MFKDMVKIDVLTKAPGLDFQSAWTRRVQPQGHGVQFNAVSLDDLLASKRATRRPKDILDIAYFEQE